MPLKFLRAWAVVGVSLVSAMAPAKGGPVDVPLFDDGALVRIPVSVFGATRYFIFDTGSEQSCFDARYAARLGQPQRTVTQDSGVARVKTAVFQAPPMRLRDRTTLVSRACPR